MKKRFQRALALLLCAVVLASCPVFSVSTAVAQTPQGPYDVKVSIQVMKRGYFDDNGGYPGLGNKKQATAGVSIVCVDKNGTGEEQEEYGWDLGTQGYNYCDTVGSYELSATEVGFPCILGGYMCGKTLSTEMNTEKSIQIQKLEVRAHSEDNEAPYTELWSGVMQLSTKINGYGAYIDNTGYVTAWDKGLKNADSGSQGDSNNYILEESKYGWQDKMPYADSVEVTSTVENGWPGETALSISDNTSTFVPNGITCYDQYGVPIEEPSRVLYGIKAYDYAAYGLSQSDLQMDQDSGQITKSGESYIAGHSAAHTVTMEVSVFFGSKKVESETTAAVAQLTAQQVISYPSIPITWRYYADSDDADAPLSHVESSALFGNMVQDSDYPGAAATRGYYTNHHHYVGGSFAAFRALVPAYVTMEGYEQQEHNFESYQPIQGNAVYHNYACACGYAIKQEHQWNDGEITAPATCTQEGVKTYTCSLCGATKEEKIATTTHIWDNGEITTAPSCGKSGIKTYRCSICGATKTEPVSALEHEPVLHTIAPSDKHNGGAYYRCAKCGCFWVAVYNSEAEDYDIPDETPLATVEEALAGSEVLPAPSFNIFNDTQLPYDYSRRGAALKYVHLKLPDYQPLRFTASVKVPENVSAAIGSAGNAVKDVGIIYSQTRLMNSIADFEIGKENVYKMSVKEKNSAAVYDGTNWGGITKHEEADGTQLTFNLVIPVKPSNWTYEYCARAYITYEYNGEEFTVYDEAYSSRSVEYIARQVVNNPNEPQEARDYCENVILKNLV